MISNGSVPYISNPEKYDNIYDIVIEELNQKKLPFIKKYVRSLSFDHAYSGKETRAWQFSDTTIVADPSFWKLQDFIKDNESDERSSRINTNFAPLAGFTFSFKKGISLNMRYNQSSSLEPKESTQLISFIRESEKSRGKAIKKMTRGEILQKEVLGKSIVCCSDIDEGQKFSEENIEVKGPAKGLSPQFYYDIIGKKSNRSIKKGAYLQDDDL